MGKFIDPREKQVTNNYVESFLKGTDLYSKYIDNPPTFVTYFNKDERQSTKNVGLSSVKEVVGDESPIKYNKIENFPIFSLEEITPAIDYDEEAGLDTMLEGVAVILPNTIVPLPDDLFIISYTEKNEPYRKLYRVSNVEMSSISSKTYYRINYEVYNRDIDAFLKRQIADDYGFVYENIGTEKKSVILESDLLLLDELQTIKDKLFQDYYHYFYIEKLGSFCYQYDANTYLYNPYMSRFIMNNELFIENRTYYKNLHIEDLLDRYKEYRNTLYYLLENPSVDSYNFASGYRLEDINTSIFSLYPEKYKAIELFGFNTKSNKKCKCNCKSLFDCDIFNLLENYENINSVNNLNPYDTLFVLYVKDFKNIQTKVFIDTLNKVKVTYDMRSFNFIPIVFFVIQKIFDRIFKI